MKQKYKQGDLVYIISSGEQILEARILRYASGFYTIRFSNGGGTKLRESRLYPSKEEALNSRGDSINDLKSRHIEIKKPARDNTVVEKTDDSSDDIQPEQIIIHVDMDAFYASVEERDDPSLKGKPLIIGSLPHERGVVSTCNYEARKYGIHSAMNIKDAYRLCPKGIYMHGDHEKYKQVSQQLHMIWNEYASVCEYLALDEAYLDVTETAGTFERACEFARIIKRRTREELKLSCSIGVAYSKTAAKMASEEKKPDGYFTIRTEKQFVDLVIDRDVKVLYTVGIKTAEKLHSNGIHTVSDIQNNQEKVVNLLGKQGRWLTRLAYGIDDSKVTAYRPEDAKSISREITFQQDVNDFDFIKDVLALLAISVERRAVRSGLYGKSVTLKITYSDMKSISRTKTIDSSRSADVIFRESVDLLKKVPHKTLRLIGTGIHRLSDKEENIQLSLEIMSQEELDNSSLRHHLELMNDRYGMNFTDDIDKLFTGENLYRAIEYMRKQHRR